MSKTNRKHRKLNTQIFLRYGLLMLAAIAIISVSFYMIFYNILLDESVESGKASVVGSGKYIESYIDKVYALSSLLANDQKVRDFIEGDDESKRAQILASIEDMLRSDEFIESVIIVTHDGRIISSDDNITMEMSPDMMKKSWYVEAIDAMPHLTPTRMNEFTQNTDSWVISVSTEIADEQGGNLGILLIDIDYRFVQEHLLGMQLKESSEVFIMNSCEELIYHKDTAYFTDAEKIRELNLCMLSQERYDRAANTLTYTYEIQNTDWTLVIMTELVGLAQLRQSLAVAMAVIIVVIGGLVLLLSRIFSRRITQPIKDLQETMSRKTHELMVLSAGTNYCEEVAGLANEYNAMIARIDALISQNASRERKIREREIEALTNQINPHFLYNTLDTILWMAESGKPEGVVDMTKALAQFFRLTLSAGMPMISVADEVDHVRQYLKIQKMRYGDMLSYTFDVDETSLACKVPKIILQPIVENAIYHGIKEKDGAGRIDISARRDGEFLRFYITDDGVGFDPNKAQPQNKPKLSGIGIKNVDERLKLQYGQDCGVTIKGELGIGTTFILTLRF